MTWPLINLQPLHGRSPWIGRHWLSRSFLSAVLKLPLLAVLLTVIGGCALPNLDNRTTSSALPAAEARNTALGRAIAPLVEAHPGKSGVYPMGSPRESFAVRVLLARAAERTLDVQYYIWHLDTTGSLLSSALYEAAERGVRVRLLLDDNGISGIDTDLATLNAHSNIEIRLFNQFMNRGFKKLGYLYDLSRLNRRMHNKSFTADAQAAVVGGRNVGDEYSGATDGVLKSDLDALLAGPVVGRIATDFDLFWSSGSAYPIDRIVDLPDATEQAHALDEIKSFVNNPSADEYITAIRESDFVSALLEGNPGLQWSEVRMVTDDSAKGLGTIKGKGLLINQLDAILARPERRAGLTVFCTNESGY